MSKLIQVAIALIVNQHNQILISLRAHDVYLGGLWEFPGGKIEIGESAYDALKREMQEELNISISQAYPFKKIKHQYVDKTIVLNVWKVESYSGDPQGAEGQQIKWLPICDLNIKLFPEANVGLIQSLQLPDKYMITGSFENRQDFESKLERSLKNGISLVQLRSKLSSKEEYKNLVKMSSLLCKKYKAKLLLNTNFEIFSDVSKMANGLHLSSKILNSTKTRPIDDALLLSASCHSLSEVKKAQQLKANIILLSPVKETNSHPGVLGIGWDKFTELATEINAPVYALGGMMQTDLTDAKCFGAQGIAAISSFWK